MDELASLIALTMNAGTPLLLAALGIVINERSGVVNLGTEGMMLVAAVVGFATTLHSGHYWLGFVAGATAGIVLALLFAVLAVGLLTNQFATGLALSLFGAGLSAFIGLALQGDTLPARGADGVPILGDIPFHRSCIVRAALARLLVARTDGGGRVVSVSHTRRFDPARSWRISRRCARARSSGAAHSLCGAGIRRRVRGPCGRVSVDDLHAAMVRRNGGGARMDRACAGDVCNVAARASAARRVSCSVA